MYYTYILQGWMLSKSIACISMIHKHEKKTRCVDIDTDGYNEYNHNHKHQGEA